MELGNFIIKYKTNQMMIPLFNTIIQTNVYFHIFIWNVVYILSHLLT